MLDQRYLLMYIEPPMALRKSFRILGLFLCLRPAFAVAQVERPLDVSEKAMAALLLSHDTPPLSAPPLSGAQMPLLWSGFSLMQTER